MIIGCGLRSRETGKGQMPRSRRSIDHLACSESPLFCRILISWYGQWMKTCVRQLFVRDLWQHMGFKNISFVGSFGKPRCSKESLPNLTGRTMLTKLVIEILWISGTLTFHIMKEIEGHPHVAQSIPGVHCLSSAMLLTSLNVTAHKGET